MLREIVEATKSLDEVDEYDEIEKLMDAGKKPGLIFRIMNKKYGTTKPDVDYIIDELKKEKK